MRLDPHLTSSEHTVYLFSLLLYCIILYIFMDADDDGKE